MSDRQASLGRLAAALPGAELRGHPETVVSGITYDSRLVERGDLFAALPGADFDGHDFVPSALARGAAALLVEHVSEAAMPAIVVPDSRAALSPLAAAFFADPSSEVGVIGITGTDGKTTTSFIADYILRASRVKTGVVGTVAIRIGDLEELHNSRQTTPESCDVQHYLRQMADHGAEWAILEATSHGLAMHRLDDVRFRIGAVTNVTHEHLDFHGSIDGYRRAKAILLERVAAEGGIAIINADDPGARGIAPFAAGARVVRYGVAAQDADLRASDIRTTAVGSTFVLDAGPDGRAAVSLPLLGSFNVANALCAAGIAQAAGLDLTAIAVALATVPAVPGRMARVASGQPFAVVVDYAHTPDSLEKVLTLLRGLHPAGRLIAVFGSAGERDRAKRPLQGATSARLADITVVTSEDPRFEDAEAIIAEIAAGARAAGGVPGESLFQRSERRDAVRLAFALARAGDCVLLAGKGHEKSIIWGREKRPWDEAAVARELLREFGYGVAG